MEKFTDEQVAELVKDKVKDITAKLPDFDDDQLGLLIDLEMAGEGRVTLLSAIDEERERRKAAAQGAGDGAENGGGDASQGDDAGGAAQGGPGEVSGSAAVQADPALVGDKSYSQAEVDALLAERDGDHADQLAQLSKRFDESWGTREEDFAAQLAAASSKGGEATPPEAATPILLDPHSETPAVVVLTAGTQVVFVDTLGIQLPGIPPLKFGPGDFSTASGEGAILNVKISFPTEAPRGEVAAAVLLADGAPVGIARLVQPFAVAGGRQSEMPAGYLLFERESADALAG